MLVNLALQTRRTGGSHLESRCLLKGSSSILFGQRRKLNTTIPDKRCFLWASMRIAPPCRHLQLNDITVHACSKIMRKGIIIFTNAASSSRHELCLAANVTANLLGSPFNLVTYRQQASHKVYVVILDGSHRKWTANTQHFPACMRRVSRRIASLLNIQNGDWGICWTNAETQLVPKRYFSQRNAVILQAHTSSRIAWPFIKVHQQIIDFLGGDKYDKLPGDQVFLRLTDMPFISRRTPAHLGEEPPAQPPWGWLATRPDMLEDGQENKVEALKLAICRQGTPIQKCASELSICTAGFHWWYLGGKGSEDWWRRAVAMLSHSLLVHSWRSETADFKFVSPVPCALCQKHLKHFLHIQLLQGTALRERFAYPVFGQEYKEAEDKSGMWVDIIEVVCFCLLCMGVSRVIQINVHNSGLGYNYQNSLVLARGWRPIAYLPAGCGKVTSGWTPKKELQYCHQNTGKHPVSSSVKIASWLGS